MLSFAEGGAIPRDFAETCARSTCCAMRHARLSATDPDAALPSPAAELCRKKAQVPFEDEIRLTCRASLCRR